MVDIFKMIGDVFGLNLSSSSNQRQEAGAVYKDAITLFNTKRQNDNDQHERQKKNQ